MNQDRLPLLPNHLFPLMRCSACKQCKLLRTFHTFFSKLQENPPDRLGFVEVQADYLWTWYGSSPAVAFSSLERILKGMLRIL
jgi:hypothetical protein